MNENEGLNCTSENCCEKEVCCDGPIQGYSETCNYEFRDFSIKKLNYGYIVTVGCHRFAIEDKKKLIKVVSEYIDDPDKVEKSWWNTKKI